MYDEFDDAAFLGNNEAIAGCTAPELLQALPSDSETFYRLDVARTASRRRYENVKSTLPRSPVACLAFQQTPRTLLLAGAEQLETSPLKRHCQVLKNLVSVFASTAVELSPHFWIRIWPGVVITISGMSRWLVIFPVTQTFLSRYIVSGLPNFALSVPQITIVKICFGYGISRFINVGRPFVFSAK
jgi:hypothetical protein